MTKRWQSTCADLAQCKVERQSFWKSATDNRMKITELESELEFLEADLIERTALKEHVRALNMALAAETTRRIQCSEVLRSIAMATKQGALYESAAIHNTASQALRATAETFAESAIDQAPIARVIVTDDAPAWVVLYAPGLPPGEFDVYLEPTETACVRKPMLSDMSDALIRELHRQDLVSMRSEFDGATLRIDPL